MADRLSALDEAAALYRRLARAHPAEHLADLGSCLASLVKCLDATGRKREAFTTAEEAVAIYRQLAASEPPAHLGCLATGLSDLAARLGPNTRLAPLREVVAIHRRLAGSDPDGQLPHLAAALHALAAALDELGEGDEAWSARLEADAVLDALNSPLQPLRAE
jgi:citrate lyase beta subunit